MESPKLLSVHSASLTYQNLLFCRVPIKSILGFIIRTYKNVGFGRLSFMKCFQSTIPDGPRCKASGLQTGVQMRWQNSK